MVAALWTLFLSQNSSGASGSLDTTFGGTGKVRTGFGGGISQAYAAALQPDGKLVIAGTTGTDTSAANFTIVRLDTNNVLDLSFGEGGKVVTSTASGIAPYSYGAPAAVKVQADGKIVAGGYGFQGTNHTDFLLVRYNADGSLDSSFGGTGRVYTDFGFRSQVSALAVQGDGRIVAVGWIGSDSQPTHFALARYDTNGVLDGSFGSGGTAVLSTFYGGANACMLQSDGKIVVVGQGGNFDFATARCTTNGVLDPSFGGGTGYVVTQFPNIPNYTPWAVPTAVATQFGNDTIQNPDRIVVSGWAEHGTAANLIAIARYNMDGTPDSTFGTGGKMTNSILPGVWGDSPQAMLVQGFLNQPRKIVIAGRSYSNGRYVVSMARFNSSGTFDTTFGGGTGKTTISFSPGDDVACAMFQQGGGYLLAGSAGFTSHNTDFTALRVTSDGSLDSTYGTNGVVLADVADRTAQANGIAVQADGKTVAAGFANDGDHDHFALARYNPDGSLDSTFGSGGKVTTRLSTNDQANAIAVQSDGKIVAAGKLSNGANDFFAAVRYDTNGVIDGSFGAGGIASMLIGTGGECKAIRIQPDGKVLLAGYATVGSYANFAMARFNANGTPDATFGGGGNVTTAFLPNPSYSVAAGAEFQSGGRIVLAGLMQFVNGTSIEQNFALARYATNGAIDFSFGASGRVTTDFSGGTLDTGNAMLTQPDGKIVVGGGTSIYPNSYVGLARYSTNGVIDGSFGNNGLVITQVGFASDYINALALQPDGRIVGGGVTKVGTNNNFFAVRYTTNGAVDSTFGVNGIAPVNFGTGMDEQCYALALDAAGRAVLGGGAGGAFAVARLTSDNIMRISSIVPLPNGHMLLTGVGLPSANHTVRASGALNVGLTSIGSVTSDASGNWQYEDNAAAGFGMRYYQLSYP